MALQIRCFPINWRRRSVAFLLAVATASAQAGLLGGTERMAPELPPPPPPAFSTASLVPVDSPSGAANRFGIDPQTITLGSDGIVRYVVVSHSSDGNALTALYEGIRCQTAEVKLYARHFGGDTANGSADGWRPVAEPSWTSLYEARTRYSLAIAQAGVCRNAAPNSSPRQIVQDLRSNPGGAPP